MVSVAERSSELRGARVPFVHARIVLAEPPTSAKPGDEAIVLADGTLEGFIGGTCAESTVREESLRSLAAGVARLVRITPQAEVDQPGKVVVHNPCLSGGTMEVYLEPALPTPLVLVVGGAPIAEALARLGTALGYAMRSVDAAGSTAETIPDGVDAVIVATHGRDEEAVLVAALAAEVPYVGLVASPRRGRAVLDGLDVPAEVAERVRTPAGLDIGARTPDEVALSILAQIVDERPRAGVRVLPVAPAPATGMPQLHHANAGDAVAGSAIDPVCGMSVATVPASLHLDHEGQRYWFCGPGCQHAFADAPANYLA